MPDPMIESSLMGCPNCGKMIESGQHTCHLCGFELPEEPVEGAGHGVGIGHKLYAVLFALVGLALLASALVSCSKGADEGGLFLSLAGGVVLLGLARPTWRRLHWAHSADLVVWVLVGLGGIVALVVGIRDGSWLVIVGGAVALAAGAASAYWFRSHLH